MGYTGWRTLPLDDVVRLRRGFDLPTSKRISGDVPVVGSSGISGWHNKAMIKGPGVVVGRAGAMGWATYVKQDFWPLNTTLFVEDFCGNDPRFIYALLHSLDFSGYNSGAVQPMLNRNYIRAIPVALPTISEQQAIGDVLDVLDGRIIVNERLRATSLDLAKAMYSASGMVTSVRLGEVVEIFDGPHATPEKTEEGPWFLSISSLKDGFLDIGESAHLAEADFAQWTRRVQPRVGDVLFSYETRLGSAALMTPGVRGCLGRRMGLLRTTSEGVSGALVLHAYLSPRFQEEIRRRTIHGATVDRISLKELPAWPISLPIAEDRARLSAELEALHSYVAQTLHENRTLAELRDTLLPKLMSGEIRVKDAEQVVEEAV